MSEVKINYYQVLNNTNLWDIDESNGVALVSKTEQGKKWTIDKDKYVKSFGQVRNLKTPDQKKEQFLVLVNGSGILMKEVKLYKDEVDDCGCDGNPIATPTDLSKLDEEEVVHKEIDKESAYINKKSIFDKSGLAGFFIGALIGTGIVWFSTKDKKKTIIGAISGAVLGMIIGYFIGRRGTKKLETVNNTNDIERKTNNTSVEEVEPGSKIDSDKQGFFQLGQMYDFTIPYPVYAMILEDNTFFVAKDPNGNKAIIKPKKVRGKLVEVKEPNIFVADPISKKVVKIQSKKPLPFLDLGNNIFIPLSVVEPASMISTEEAMKFLSGEGGLDEDIYVKGRYTGKKMYNLMYIPNYAVTIKQKFGN